MSLLFIGSQLKRADKRSKKPNAIDHIYLIYLDQGVAVSVLFFH